MSAQIDFLWVLLGTIMIVAVAFTFAAYVVISNRRELAIRIRTEEALKDSEQQYRRIIEEANDTVYTTDPTGHFLYINPPTQKLTGYSRDELIGMHFTELIPQDWRDRVKQFYIRQFEDHVRDTTLEFPILTRAGEEKWVEQKVTILTFDQRVTGFQSIVRDITERKRAEKGLRKSEERYRTVVEDMPALICRFRPDGTLSFVNNVYCQYFSKTYEELVGHNFFQFIPVDDREKVREHYDSISKEKPAITYEHQVIAPDGTIRWQRWTDRGLFDEGGALVEYQSIGEDITAHKQAEEELRKLSEQLQNLSVHLQSVREKERTNLAREIHDELGQALTALQIDLYWLVERVPVGKKDLIQKINSMSDVIETVIQSTQRISTELRPVLLDTLGLSAAIEWQVEEFQKRTGIQCEVAVYSADIDLDSDRSTAIFRILQESLTNVARHADATEVKVWFNRHTDKLILEVVDNGKGITQDQISGSMAFGLIGMRERVRPWGGEFNISGAKGKGTKVTATISLDN